MAQEVEESSTNGGLVVPKEFVSWEPQIEPEATAVCVCMCVCCVNDEEIAP